VLPPDLIIITDLDGSLLDRNTYSWAAAEEALREIARRGIPLVFCTSKTRAEVEVLRRRMGNAHPFIVENGGGVFIPDGYFPRRLKDTIKVRHYHCLALGRPYAELIEAFEAILEETGLSAEGFHKMRPRDIARNSGLPLEDAQRAAQREFDLPFFFAGSNEEEEKTFIAAARERKLTVVRGTRFWHLFSGSDKGRAVRTLIELYRAALPHQRLRTVALGDCAHDLPMLAAADKAVLIPQRRDQFDEDVLDKLPRIIRAPAPGPAGWNAVVLSLLR
jgi:mannosyl-3-phosphoglycerate phosphatase